MAEIMIQTLYVCGATWSVCGLMRFLSWNFRIPHGDSLEEQHAFMVLALVCGPMVWIMLLGGTILRILLGKEE